MTQMTQIVEKEVAVSDIRAWSFPDLPHLRTLRIDCLSIVRLPPMDFLEACHLQRAYANARGEGLIGDTLLLAQHPPTFCTGVLGKDEHLLLSEADRQAVGIPYYRVDRGGDVMYVGPGQVVAYPILRLAEHGLDPIGYLRALEEVIIRTLAGFGIRGHRLPGLTGVWVDEAKIAGVAVKVTGGVSMYGFNLNVSPDLSFYRHIVTCGNHGRPVASMERLLGRAPSLRQVEECVVESVSEVLGLRRGMWGCPPHLKISSPAPLVREWGTGGEGFPGWGQEVEDAR